MENINQLSVQKIKEWLVKTVGQKTYEKQGISPSKDWKIILTLTAVFFLLEAILSVFIYFQIKNGVWFDRPSDAMISKISINQNLLKGVTDSLDSKVVKYFNQNISVPADPSF